MGAEAKRVLLVLHEDTPGGATVAALRAIEPLLARGLELYAWCSRPSELFDYLEGRGIAVAGAPRLLRYSWSTLRHPPGVARRLASVPRTLAAFRRYLREVDPDLVHANATLSLPEGAVARAAGYPVLYYSHEPAWPGLKGRLLRASAWLIADQVAAVSRANAAPLTTRRRRPRLLPGSAPLDRPASSRLRPAGAPVVVGSIGAITRRKGTDVFLSAVERLPGREALDLRLVGAVEDSPEADWAQEQLARARAAGIGHRDHIDVPAELPEWDVVVLASRRDPFPLAVLEAMAAGRAILATRVDGIEEQLSGGAGVLVPPEDPGALAAAIAELAADPERRAELGAAAHARFLADYTVERGAERLAAAYADTLRR